MYTYGSVYGVRRRRRPNDNLRPPGRPRTGVDAIRVRSQLSQLASHRKSVSGTHQCLVSQSTGSPACGSSWQFFLWVRATWRAFHRFVGCCGAEVWKIEWKFALEIGGNYRFFGGRSDLSQSQQPIDRQLAELVWVSGINAISPPRPDQHTYSSLWNDDDVVDHDRAVGPSPSGARDQVPEWMSEWTSCSRTRRRELSSHSSTRRSSEGRKLVWRTAKHR